jgi:methionine sulfoxide reductase heme-binding subunit
MHVTSNPIDWYAARAAGIAAYLLLSFVLVLGMTMARNARIRRWPKFAIEDVHRFAGLLVGTFVTIHVVTIAIDAWLPFSVASIIVPFVSRYRPLWVACGIVAAELLLALAVTNHYRDRLTYRFWRRAHYLNLVVWGLATVHGVASGTDRSAPWLLALYALSTAAVGAAAAWRFGRGRVGLRRWVPVVGLAGATLAGLAVLLGATAFAFRPKPWNAVSFTEPLSGHIAQLSGVTRGIVSMAGEGTGVQSVLVRADLLLRPGGIERTAFQMEYLPSGLRCTGSVTKAEGFGFNAACRLPTGARRFVTAQWQGTGTASDIAGTITAHA